MKAVFLDRDGVIIEDANLLSKKEDIKIIEGSAKAIRILNDKGFLVLVITNQPVVARGIITEKEVEKINNDLIERISKESGGKIDKFYFCPHHPNANLKEYRKVCECRKPSPGMILEAAKDFNIDLKESWMIGDMITDIVAGKKAGCKTIMVKSKQNDKIIETGKEFDSVEPDYKTESLYDSLKIILK